MQGQGLTFGLENENNMAVKKEAVEIECSECPARFRLWVPSGMMSELEKGARINCVRCGTAYSVKRNVTGFSIMPAREKAAAAAPEPEAPQPEPSVKSKNHILIVDDDKLAREMVDHSFKDSGLTMMIVKNAKEAIQAVQTKPVTLIVTDMHLKNQADPDATMDGEELLRKIVSLGFKIPSVLTTGKDIIDDLVEDPKWFDLNVKSFIQKGSPFWVEELKAKIQELLLD
ncbi:MAG: response regulator [Deltaproteobacteria bacterium]|nr:response regulator [Deltaproteobacteria bacterium]